MKITELRIGNLIYDPDGFELTVTEMGEGTLGSEDSIYKEADVTGIPLTEEWLVKLGFVDHETFWSHTWGTNGVVIITYSQVYKSFMYQLAQSVDKLITTVHQLQNLYFALTGEELKLA